MRSTVDFPAWLLRLTKESGCCFGIANGLCHFQYSFNLPTATWHVVVSQVLCFHRVLHQPTEASDTLPVRPRRAIVSGVSLLKRQAHAPKNELSRGNDYPLANSQDVEGYQETEGKPKHLCCIWMGGRNQRSKDNDFQSITYSDASNKNELSSNQTVRM